MNIELKEITVRDLTNGYKDNAEDGVIGYNGQLETPSNKLFFARLLPLSYCQAGSA